MDELMIILLRYEWISDGEIMSGLKSYRTGMEECEEKFLLKAVVEIGDRVSSIIHRRLKDSDDIIYQRETLPWFLFNVAHLKCKGKRIKNVVEVSEYILGETG